MRVPVPTEGFGQMQAVPHRSRSDIPFDIVLHKWIIKKVDDRGYISPNYCVVRRTYQGLSGLKEGPEASVCDLPLVVTAGATDQVGSSLELSHLPHCSKVGNIKDGSGPTFCSFPWRAEPSCGHE